MRRLECLWVAAAASIVLIFAVPAFGDDYSGTIVGTDVGAAIPVSEFQDTAKIGGVVAPFIGHRFSNRGYAFTPMVRTQFAFFPAKGQTIIYPPGQEPSAGGNRIVRARTIDSDVQTLFGGTAGFRLSSIDSTKEIFIGGHGGYYTDLGMGPVRGGGMGFSIEAGLNYQLLERTQVGLFVRRDEAYIPGNLNPAEQDDNLEYITTGLTVTQQVTYPAEPPPPPPPPPPAPAAEEPEMPEVTKKIVLRGVTFAFDSDRLSSDATPILDEAVKVLKDAGDVAVSIEGHTDATGPESYNLGLSQRRAASVSKYLSDNGIDAERLNTTGFGEEKPVASNATREGRAQNRRVELRVEE